MENLRALEYENITTHFSECPVPVRDSSVCAGMGEFCKDMIEFFILHFHLLTAQWAEEEMTSQCVLSIEHRKEPPAALMNYISWFV